MHVLVADDDRPFVVDLEARLRALGHRVTVAMDGRAALRVLARDPTVEVAILNWLLPRLDGWRLCVALRRAGRQDVHTILAVGRGFLDAARVRLGCADDYLGKPLIPEQLHRMLAAARRAWIARTAGAALPPPGRWAPSVRLRLAPIATVRAGRPCRRLSPAVPGWSNN